jgi:hypothetical protein
MNIKTKGLVVKPYQLALKYPNYKKDVSLNDHVKVFSDSCSNEWRNLGGVHH